VWYISSELEEVCGSVDRVGVLCKARLMGLVERDKAILLLRLMMAGGRNL